MISLINHNSQKSELVHWGLYFCQPRNQNMKQKILRKDLQKSIRKFFFSINDTQYLCRKGDHFRCGARRCICPLVLGICFVWRYSCTRVRRRFLDNVMASSSLQLTHRCFWMNVGCGHSSLLANTLGIWSEMIHMAKLVAKTVTASL